MLSRYRPLRPIHFPRAKVARLTGAEIAKMKAKERAKVADKKGG